MKKLLFIVFVLLPVFVRAKLQGQVRVDSLLKELPKAKEDTNKIKLLLGLSNDYRFFDPDEGIKYGSLALALAVKLSWKNGVANADNKLGMNYQYKSEYPKALDYFNTALEIDEEIGDKNNVAAITCNIGMVYNSRGDYANALEYYLKASKMDEEIGNKKDLAVVSANIGRVYDDQNDFPRALEYDFKSLKMLEEIGDKNGIAHVSNAIGIVYNDQNDYPKALDYYIKALKIANETGNKNLIAAENCNIGVIYKEQNDYSKAMEYFFKALKMDEEIGNKNFIAIVMGNIGEVYTLQKNYAKATEYYQKALVVAEEIGDKHTVAAQLQKTGHFYLLTAKDTSKLLPKDRQTLTIKTANLKRSINYLGQSMAICNEMHFTDVLSDVYENLADAYRLSGNYKAALENTDLYNKIKDSIFSTDNKVKLANLATQREADLKEKQIVINEKQTAVNQLAVTQKRNERIIFGAGSAMLLVVIIAGYRNYKAQKRTNKLQADALLQKEVLMKEIHHRVKNTLEVISSLMDLQLVNISDERAREAITESTVRLRAISWIHHQLYRGDHITTIECSQFIIDLHAHISAAFHKPGQNILFNTRIPEIILDVDTAVPLGLILNELMTNSYKYAFDSAGGNIDCKMEKADEGYKLTYSDSGPGLPSEMDIKSLKSLGMMMMKGLSKQIGGLFNYVAASKTFTVTFRDAAEMKKAA